MWWWTVVGVAEEGTCSVGGGVADGAPAGVELVHVLSIIYIILYYIILYYIYIHSDRDSMISAVVELRHVLPVSCIDVVYR